MKANKILAYSLFFSILAFGFLLAPSHRPSEHAVARKSLTMSDNPYLVKNINPRTHDSYPRCIAVGESYAVCGANDGLPGVRLWRSDGTPEGTFMLKEIFENEGSVDLHVYAATKSGKLYFLANAGCCRYEDQLWQTDGTSTGTIMVKEFDYYDIGDFVTIGETLYFIRATGDLQIIYEIWQSDGTEEGTHPIFDFSAHNYNHNLTTFNGHLYFTRYTDSHGIELWISDGSATNTIMLADIYPGAGSSEPEQLTSAGNHLFFVANDGTHGRELWLTDGTEEGTRLVKDFSSDSSTSYVEELIAVGDLVFFSARDSEGSSLWRSDGFEAGTFKIPVTGFYMANSKTAAGNLLYITIEELAYDTESLWRTDGSVSGTYKLKELSIRHGCRPESAVIPVGNQIYFPANLDTAGCELWHSDGTEEGTQMVQDILPGTDSSEARPLAYVNDLLLMRVDMFPTANDGSPDDSELWATDRSADGARLLLNINITPVSSEPSSLVTHNGILYLSANDGDTGMELWSSDGTESGTQIVSDINPGGWGSIPSNMAATVNGLVFTARTMENGYELYVTDGTASGTTVIKNFDGVRESSYVRDMAEWKGYAFFNVIHYPDEVYEFWRTDGTKEGTLRLGQYFVEHMIAADNQLYFIKRAVSPNFGLSNSPAGVGMTDGTPGATSLIEGLPEHQCELYNSPMAVIGDTLFFAWCDDSEDRELWNLEGPSGKPFRVADINPQDSSNPVALTAYNNFVYFTADDGEHGRAMWRSDGTELGTELVTNTPAYQITPYSSGFFFLENGLWVSDGTAVGTKKLYDGPYIADMVIGADRLYFSHEGYEENNYLMVSDGTAAGTGVVGTNGRGSGPSNLTVAGDKLFFTGKDESGDRELWALNLDRLPPVADFSASPETGAPPLSVNFNNLSTGDYDQCLWDFGDGGTKAVCDGPKHEYKYEGYYTVSLTVKGLGGEGTKTVEECVKVAYYRLYLPGVLRK